MLPLTTVTIMVHVPTLLGASHVDVTKVILEMESLVKVCTTNQAIGIDLHGYHSDIDECASATTNNCDSNATCTNTPGGFTCMCNQGYTGNGITCEGMYIIKQT